MSDDDPATALTARQDGTGIAVSLDAVISILHSFSAMLTGVEARLSEQNRENAEHARERWQEFQRETTRWREGMEARVTALEGSVHEHHSAEQAREIAYQARVRPVRSLLGWVWDNRRDLLLVFVGIVALATLLMDFFGHALGIGGMS